MPRIHESFNHDWLFLQEDQPSFSLPSLDDSAWRRLSLPHDWSNESVPEESNPSGSGGGFVRAGIAWYRKHFSYDPRLPKLYCILLYSFKPVFLNSINEII